MTVITWIGIALCLLNSAMFSGLTIGLFGLSRLFLEIQAEAKNVNAIKILNIRKDTNFLLSTLLWGNVSVNVLLALLTDSLMTGLWAFLFSTIGITIFGEIIPQAFFSRHALRFGASFVPIVRFYETLLYPIAKPTAFLLDLWLGKEGVRYFQEHEFEILLKKHALSGSSDISKFEALGALNFLALDDILIKEEGEKINPSSIIQLPSKAGIPTFPSFSRTPDDPFLNQIRASKKKWVIITDKDNNPLVVLDADYFLQEAIFEKEKLHYNLFCHRPLVVTTPGTKLGQVLGDLKVEAEHSEDDVVDHDIILYWNKEKRIITGADILGRLLRGIVSRVHKMPPNNPPNIR
ncbi:Mg2+ and Co2+ transporter CorB [bacterium F11]|nr:Mg2+ and Co2+ transporter CorB [bacterium F11]